MIGLALLYPAREWNCCVPGHHGYPSRPRRPYGPPDHERAGETFSPSPHSDSQTAGKPTLALGSAKAVPSEPPSLARPIWRATGATGVGGHPLGEPERVHQAAAFVTRAS